MRACAELVQLVTLRLLMAFSPVSRHPLGDSRSSRNCNVVVRTQSRNPLVTTRTLGFSSGRSPHVGGDRSQGEGGQGLSHLGAFSKHT